MVPSVALKSLGVGRRGEGAVSCSPPGFGAGSWSPEQQLVETHGLCLELRLHSGLGCP